MRSLRLTPIYLYPNSIPQDTSARPQLQLSTLVPVVTGSTSCATVSGSNVCVQGPVQLSRHHVTGGTGVCGISVSFQYPFQFWLPFTSLNKQQHLADRVGARADGDPVNRLASSSTLFPRPGRVRVARRSCRPTGGVCRLASFAGGVCGWHLRFQQRLHAQTKTYQRGARWSPRGRSRSGE